MKATLLTKLSTTFLRYRESIKLGAVLGSLVANFIILGIVFNNSQQTSDLATRVRHLVISQDQEDTKRQQESEARLARALEDNAKQHEKTQRYMLCIANILLKPIANRDSADFDQCGLVGTSGQQKNSASSPNAVVSPEPSSVPTSPKPTTSAPPDPDRQGFLPGLFKSAIKSVNDLLGWLL